MQLPLPEPVATLLADILFNVVFLKGLALSVVAVLLGTGLARAPAAGRASVWTAALAGLLVLSGTVIPWMWKVGIPEIWEVGIVTFPQPLYKRMVPGVTLHGQPASVAAWLGVVWAAGAALLLVRFGLALVRIGGITRRSRPIRAAALDALVRGALSSSGPRASIRVRLTDELRVPVTWGLRRPVILLPAAALHWSEDALRAVLRHEAAHVARRDYLALVALELARALHWPNPLVWYLVWQAHRDQERACDAAAVALGMTPADYARHLVAVARSAIESPPTPAALSMVRRSVLGRRVQDVMRLDAGARRATRRTAVIIFLVMGLAALQLSVSNLWACPVTGGPLSGTVLTLSGS